MHNPVAPNSQMPLMDARFVLAFEEKAPLSFNFIPQELFSTQRENYVHLNLDIMKGQWTDKICSL